MFVINGIAWNLSLVEPYSDMLRRSDGSITLGVTDENLHTIFLNNRLKGDMFERVLCHELTHTVCMSWGISIPIETEEWLCNFMSDHGKEVIYLLDDLLFALHSKVV